MNKPKFTVGQIVYVNYHYYTADKCEIANFVENESSTHKPVYKLHSLDLLGTYSATEDAIFDSYEKAVEAYNDEFNKRVNNYCSEINTLEDLIKFPINHCICGDEDVEYEARQAYLIRAKDLCNISIE